MLEVAQTPLVWESRWSVEHGMFYWWNNVTGVSSWGPPTYCTDFLRDSLLDTAFCYADPQIMRPGDQEDPLHYDGGASLLHMGLTVYQGRRAVN